MIFYGDIHGDFQWLQKNYKKDSPESICQLGDMGVGFMLTKSPSKEVIETLKSLGMINSDTLTSPPVLGGNFRFIAGNHDNPDLCLEHPNCLGRWGYIEEIDLFYISGGYSIDYIVDGVQYRTPMIDWWANEELSNDELGAMIDKFVEVKPRYVISHECPGIAQSAMFPFTMKRQINNRTKLAMDQAFVEHSPEYWMFGHYHVNKSFIHEEGGTHFRCIDINQKYEIRNLDWPEKIKKEIFTEDLQGVEENE